MLLRGVVNIASMTILLLVIYVFYLWYTYIDETVKSGEAYGFVIGDSKSKTFKALSVALPKISGGEKIFIQLVVTDNNAQILSTNTGHTIMVQTYLHDIGYKEFELKDRWEFLIGGTFFNKIILRFCDGRLCEVYRHRKYFELP